MHDPTSLARRTVVHGAAAALAAALARSASAQDAAVRVAIIGDGRTGLWTSIRAGAGNLDIERAVGARVVWQPGFTASLPVMEAIRADGVDFTFATSTAVINAIGAGVPITPLAAFALPKTTIDGIVGADAAIHGPADLRGKRVAYQRGTTGQYSVIKYLDRANLRLSDVEGVSLSGTDGFTALARGDVDAWFHWQPAAALGLERLGPKVRRLPDVPTFDYAFYVASDRFAEHQLDTAVKLVRVIRDTQDFINAHPAETVKLWAAQGGLQPDGAEARVFEQLVREQRLSESTAISLGPVGEAAARTTQEMADSFHALGVLPRRVDVTGFLLSERAQRPAAAVSAALRA